MIELTTGVPGSGKTLSMVDRLNRLQTKWARDPAEIRPVFVSGIPDLALPHTPLPLKSVQLSKSATPSLVPDWEALPDGALVIISEAQGCFPPRSSQSTPPEHVSFLNVHRHKGLDIWLDTQHPKLIDGSVRALVGKHQHYRRLFGGQRAVVYEWDSCSDSLSGMAAATKSFYTYPRHAFKFYKSAEIHTKQSFKLPLWLFIPLLSVPLAFYFIPHAYDVFANGMSGKTPVVESAPSGSVSAVPAPAPDSESVPSKRSMGVPVAISAPLQISACVASESFCRCYTATGIRLKMSDAECRAAAASPNEFFRLNEQAVAIAAPRSVPSPALHQSVAAQDLSAPDLPQ
ncbi:MAG: zonular occludens toxin domain-containing protein [Gallionella sp.]|nr:zonular occludens toxin domain-containing protein [Gallionella sp.]